MTKFYTFFSGFALVSVLVACSGDKKPESSQPVNSGIDLAGMDTTIDPRNDFYRYANGNWLKTTKIPSDQSKWSNFNIIDDENLSKLKGLLAEVTADKSALPGSNKQKVRDLYLTAMDSVKLNKDGIAPIVPFLEQIKNVKEKKDLTMLVASQHLKGVGAAWHTYTMPDLKNSSAMTLYLSQGGLGLPDPDYYTKKDPQSIEMRNKYVDHVKRMFEACGNEAGASEKMAQTVLKLESDLAASSMNAVQRRDVQKQYNPMSVEELQKLCPSVDWKTYLQMMGIKDATMLVVEQTEFFKKINTMFSKGTLNDWIAYFQWQFIDHNAMVLNDQLLEFNFDFYFRTLQGTKEMKPRWKRSLEMVDGLLGEALGELYVEKYFSKEAKAKMNELVDNLFAVYSERIKALDWMSDSTKQRALEKLSTIIRKLGYPDQWRDYRPLEIGSKSLAENYWAATEFEVRRNLAKYGKPVDKTEWGMSPPTVNAYYNPTVNEIVFPAGILQPPFFDLSADDAANYARIGTVIGHEITHGFDDQGSQFDKDGNLKDWWTAADKDKFSEKTKQVIDQFNGYVAIDSLHINGALTVGENIADLGGFTMAYYAYIRSLQGKEKKNLDGFTPEQRFFIAGAQMWRSLFKDEALRRQVETNPHSPGEFRVTGPFSNMPEFYQAFGVKDGHKMYRDEKNRAKIW